MKLPKVVSKYPDEVHMISFNQFRKWSYYSGFQYDWITNKRHIEEALKYANLNSIDLSLEWQDDKFLMETQDIREGLKHAIRVAALIQLIQNGGGVVPVDIDTFTILRCRSCIPDGHHRIRMLRYLGYTHFPAYCTGDSAMFERLINTETDKLIEFI